LIKELEDRAFRIRGNLITIFEHSRAGHVGGSMSLVELVTALYFHHMKIDPKNPEWPGRDRLILSKAHSCETLYAAFVELNWFPREMLKKYMRLGSPFQGHADRWATSGIEFSGGSLGEGLSFAAGVALASLLDKPVCDVPIKATYRYPPKYRVYCILGDGECHEGQVWEAAMTAAHYKLDNLIAIVDYNKYAHDGPITEVMGLDPFAEKWRSFGWWVTEIDGHNMTQIIDALELAENLYGDRKPKCIIAHTVKGKGVPTWELSHAHYGREPILSRGLEEGKSMYLQGERK
jgi:transketolase